MGVEQKQIRFMGCRILIGRLWYGLEDKLVNVTLQGSDCLFIYKTWGFPISIGRIA